MALSRIDLHIPQFTALSTDIVGNMITNFNRVGALVYLTDTKVWMIANPDMTLAPYITNVSVLGKVDINSLPSNNFTPLKVTLVAGVPSIVKASSGYVGNIQTALTDLLLKNATTEVWSGNGNFSNPIYLDTSINLVSATGGVVYISYR